MNEFRGGELQKTVDNLINKHGMEDILSAIIRNLTPLEIYGENYIKLLLVNLNETLKNYNNRYD